jgi:hypothetical protein
MVLFNFYFLPFSRLIFWKSIESFNLKLFTFFNNNNTVNKVYEN